MKTVRSFTVVPRIPDRLKSLLDIAYNLWWSWNPEAIALFRRLDRQLWEKTFHNPVWTLGLIDQKKLDRAAEDVGFLAHMDRVNVALARYMTRETWYDRIADRYPGLRIAYFSAEYGLTDCILTYSGGLGLLAGDHLKSASDLGLPMVAVGLMYREGYFQQYLNADGWQQEAYPDNDFYNMPARLYRTREGEKVVIEVEYPNGPVKAQVWHVQVGRVPLFLLDTNLPENRPEDREITAQLYGGDLDMRIRQEIMLGIGGLRALDAINLYPRVCHMNEGHSAFLGLERVILAMKRHKLDFATARDGTMGGNIFTTHTPVPAGIDLFPPYMIERYFANYRNALGIPRGDLLAMGRQNPDDENEPFSMAVLALKLSSRCNAVSQLHGVVSRKMWRNVWPGVPVEEIPITSITNGVHVQSWISGELAALLDRYIGPPWVEDPADQTVWQLLEQIPDEELWRTHERRRERMVAFVRRRLREQLERRGAPPVEIAQADEVLDPEALTIGFARRFATYKRATLLLRDPERLARLLTRKDRPVQLVFAGKAHPRDNSGKELIRQIVHFARRDDVRRRVVFLENYDMCIARYLVQGVDVWLNTPRRPMEASGTSGMKAAVNGALNMSILDGWWCEAYNRNNGWAIGAGEEYDDLEYQDQVESNAAFDLLEKEVVPLFYERGADGLPRGWIRRMKNSMLSICPVFNTHRMVMEYFNRLYAPCAEYYWRMAANERQRASLVAAWKKRVLEAWPKLKIESVRADVGIDTVVGSDVHVTAVVQLGGLKPEDVLVEIYHGLLDNDRQITGGSAVPMRHQTAHPDGTHTFVGSIRCTVTGQYGYAIRVVPHHVDMVNNYDLRRILWG